MERGAQSQPDWADHPTGPPSQPSPGLLQTQRAESPKSELWPPLPKSELLCPGDPGTAPTSPAFSGVLPISLYPLRQHLPHLCLLRPHIFSHYVLPGRRSNLPLADKLLQRQFHMHTSCSPTSLLSYLSFFSKRVPSLNFTVWTGGCMEPYPISLTKSHGPGEPGLKGLSTQRREGQVRPGALLTRFSSSLVPPSVHEPGAFLSPI